MAIALPLPFDCRVLHCEAVRSAILVTVRKQVAKLSDSLATCFLTVTTRLKCISLRRHCVDASDLMLYLTVDVFLSAKLRTFLHE